MTITQQEIKQELNDAMRTYEAVSIRAYDGEATADEVEAARATVALVQAKIDALPLIKERSARDRDREEMEDGLDMLRQMEADYDRLVEIEAIMLDLIREYDEKAKRIQSPLGAIIDRAQAIHGRDRNRDSDHQVLPAFGVVTYGTTIRVGGKHWERRYRMQMLKNIARDTGGAYW